MSVIKNSNANACSSHAEPFELAGAFELQTIQGGGAWDTPTYGCEAQGGCGLADKFYYWSWKMFFGGA